MKRVVPVIDTTWWNATHPGIPGCASRKVGLAVDILSVKVFPKVDAFQKSKVTISVVPSHWQLETSLEGSTKNPLSV